MNKFGEILAKMAILINFPNKIILLKKTYNKINLIKLRFV